MFLGFAGGLPSELQAQEPIPATFAREIKILAAVSSSFKQNPEWKKDIVERVLFANQIFEKQFGIHFSVKNYTAWEPQDEIRPAGLLIEELRSTQLLGGGEIVIGFHKMTKAFGGEALEDIDTVGAAEYFKGFVVIRDPFQQLLPILHKVALTHEFAHLFGAVHIAGETELMNPVAVRQPSLRLDEDNSQIIHLTRRVDFRKGLDSFDPEVIDGLIANYERLIRKNPHSDFYYQLGHFYAKRGLLSRGVSIWEEAVKYQYDNPLIHWELGAYYYQTGRYDAAIRELGSAVAYFVLPSQKKQQAATFNFLGVAYHKKGNTEQAIFNWLKGLGADPENFELQSNLAVAYLESGDLERGISELLKLLAKDPHNAMVLSNLGLAYFNKKEYQKAVDYFQKMLAQSVLSGSTSEGQLMQGVPEAEIRLNLGAAYLGLGKFAEAMGELEKARSLEPQNAQVHRNLAQAYLEQKDYERAIKEIQEALRYKSDDPYLYAFMAQAYAQTGKRTDALQAAREGLKYAHGDLKGALHRNIAIFYAQDQKFSEAASELKLALSQNWNDPEAHAQLGVIYANTGAFEEARRSFQTALRINPKHAEAKRLLELLNQQTQKR